MQHAPTPSAQDAYHERIGCPDCALIQSLPPIASGRLRCRRCRATLERATGRSAAAALAFSLTTLILLVPANTLMLMRVSRAGFAAQVDLFAGFAVLWHQGWALVAVATALFVVLFPFLRFGLLAAVLIAVLRRRPRSWTGLAFRVAETFDQWAMPDVFLIGVAIGYSRLAARANVAIGPGGWCYVAAAFTAMLTRASIDRRRVWRALPPRSESGADGLACPSCGFVLRDTAAPQTCPRCRRHVARRAPRAMQAALALTCAGLLLYPVANLFPLSTLDWIGGTSPHTLFSAVMKLVQANLWFLAGCVFTTSIAIPFVKLAGMLWLWVSVRRRSSRHLVLKTRFYRVIDELGRWSTMDVFTVAVYLPLIQFGQLATARVNLGLPALLAVVVLTMFASRAFDPRRLWDGVPA